MFLRKDHRQLQGLAWQGLKAGRQPGKVDARFRKRAEELLYGELSVALGIPQDSVPQYIHQKLKAAGRS